MKTYIPIGQLIQDLERAYVAATNARKLAHILVCNTQKRAIPVPDKLAAARKQKSRTCANWNRIRDELKLYQKMVADAFTVIAYDGVIVALYIRRQGEPYRPKSYQQIGLSFRGNTGIKITGECLVLDYAKTFSEMEI